jgi:endonuclease III
MARGLTPRRPSRSGRQERRHSPHRGGASLITHHARPKPNSEANPKPRKASTLPPAVEPSRTKTAAAAPKPARARTHTHIEDPTSPARVSELLRRLDAAYPNVTCALQHKNSWELLVATILSAQCTDVRVNLVTPELFRQYPSPREMATLDPRELEPQVRSTGFFRNKSKSLVGAAKKLTQDFAGDVPDEMEKLLSLPGVARKTANVVLGTWFKKAEGVVVDTHVYRIARRLELTRGDNPAAVEQDLMRVIPRDKWIEFAHQLIWHGRALCLARKPRCAQCPLENICHAADKTWSTVPIHKPAKP